MWCEVLHINLSGRLAFSYWFFFNALTGFRWWFFPRCLKSYFSCCMVTPWTSYSKDSRKGISYILGVMRSFRRILGLNVDKITSFLWRLGTCQMINAYSVQFAVCFANWIYIFLDSMRCSNSSSKYRWESREYLPLFAASNYLFVVRLFSITEMHASENGNVILFCVMTNLAICLPMCACVHEVCVPLQIRSISEKKHKAWTVRRRHSLLKTKVINKIRWNYLWFCWSSRFSFDSFK